MSMKYILELLRSLNSCKATGKDNIPSSLLRVSVLQYESLPVSMLIGYLIYLLYIE